MEHLQLPRNPIHPHIKVPYLCTDHYDGGPFLQYLDRTGWTTSQILDALQYQDLDRSKEDVQALLQTWFFFGLLTDVFGIQIDISDFVTLDQRDQKWMSTKNLKPYTERWIERESVLDHKSRRDDERRMSQCITLISSMLTQVSLRGDSLLDGRLTWSFGVLVEYLLEARPFAYGTWDIMNGEWPAMEIHQLPGASDIIYCRMQQDGWCPNEIEMFTNLSSSELYFMSNLQRPGTNKDHSRCTENACMAYQLRADEYQQKHTTANCSCTLIHAPQANMEAILRGPRNRIPLITPYRTTQSGTVTYVQLLDSEQTSSFVAISHVWSDGLGNNEKNALPRCQFDRLSDLVSRLFDGQPQPFWLDTLCFPLGPQDIYDLALIRMHKSYADAQKVLLLDHYLLSANRIGMSDEEMMAMLFCSPWNRRLWTLQEGFLAKSLVIQFADTHIDILEWLDRENDNDTQAEFGNLTFNNIWVSFESLRASERGPSFLKHMMSIPETKKALAFRSTSVKDDEPLCLGNLLGLDSEEIVGAPASERMRKVWELQEDHFAPAIFWKGPKLQDEGFRWAPASFLDRSVALTKGYHAQGRELSAELSDEGLVVLMPGILLPLATQTVCAQFYVQDESASWYHVFCFQKMNGDTMKDHMITLEWDGTAPSTPSLALITLDPLKEQTSLRPDITEAAVLASVQKSDLEIIHVRLLYHVRVVAIRPAQRAATDALQQMLDGTQEVDFGEDARNWILKGRRTAEVQAWCVD